MRRFRRVPRDPHETNAPEWYDNKRDDEDNEDNEDEIRAALERRE